MRVTSQRNQSRSGAVLDSVHDRLSTRVDEFEELRPHLLSVAYRLTGTVADAEDVVQDAWLRWDRADADAITDLRAWLTTVVSRLALDRLRSAAHRRETYSANGCPNPS